MKIGWTQPNPVKIGRERKPRAVRTALVEGHAERFHLYQSRSIPTMWSLADMEGATHFLYGHGWDGAQTVAEGRIVEILTPQPKPRKRKR
jgi:hypothetical protein